MTPDIRGKYSRGRNRIEKFSNFYKIYEIFEYVQILLGTLPFTQGLGRGPCKWGSYSIGIFKSGLNLPSSKDTATHPQMESQGRHRYPRAPQIMQSNSNYNLRLPINTDTLLTQCHADLESHK